MNQAIVRLSGALALTALAGTMVGCGSDEDPLNGTLQQEWTIEGGRDIGSCERYRADRMRLVIFDSDGDLHATEFAPCQDFRTELVLRVATYTGTATFVDDQGAPVSDTLQVPQFTIFGDRPTVLSVDFDQDAMVGSQ
jgi:hypothetical protein